MILLILVVLWIVVLAPAFLKKWLDHRSTESIDSFHQQLHLLERAGPKLVPPAYRLETAQSSTGVAVGQTGFPAVSSRPGRPNLVLLQPAGTGDGHATEDEASGEHYRRVAPSLVEGPAPGATPTKFVALRIEGFRRQQTLRRRRQLLLGLSGVLTFTALLGIAPSLHGLWVVTVLAAIGLAAYVGLAAYAQLIEADRQGDRRHTPPESWGPRPVVARTGSGLPGAPGSWDDDGDGGYSEEEAPQRAAAGR